MRKFWAGYSWSKVFIFYLHPYKKRPLDDIAYLNNNKNQQVEDDFGGSSIDALA